METFLPNIAPAHPKGYNLGKPVMLRDLENQKEDQYSQRYSIKPKTNRYDAKHQSNNYKITICYQLAI